MILVTGFAPEREEINASGVLAHSLHFELPVGLEPLAARLVFAPSNLVVFTDEWAS